MPNYQPFVSADAFRASGGPGFQVADPLAGNWPGSAEGLPQPQEGDLPIWQASTGQYVSSKSGKPYTGKHAGTSYRNGVQVPDWSVQVPGTNTTINPNDPNQRYRAVSIPKLPDVASDVNDLQKTFKEGADNALKGFNDYLSQYKQQISDANKAAQDAIAFTTTDEAAMQKQQADYANALKQSQAQYADVNAADAAKQRALVSDAANVLNEYTTTDLQKAEDLAQQEVTGAVGRYGAGKNAAAGANLGFGGDIPAIAAQESYRASLPYEMAKTQGRYNLVTGVEMPTEARLAGEERSRISQFDPMVAGQVFQSGMATDRDIANLKLATAGMTYDNASRYLQSLGVPFQVWNQILGGEISTIGGIAGLQNESRYSGLQDVLGVNLSQPQSFSLSTPGYGSPSRYSPVTSTGNSLPASNAPQTVGGPVQPGQIPAIDQAYAAQTGVFPAQDKNYDAYLFNTIAAQMGYGSQPGGPTLGAPSAPVTVASTPAAPANIGDFNLATGAPNYAG